MSRTRHHSKLNESIRSKQRKLNSFKQRQLAKLKLSDWYIEVPVTRQFEKRMVK